MVLRQCIATMALTVRRPPPFADVGLSLGHNDQPLVTSCQSSNFPAYPPYSDIRSLVNY